MAEPVKHPEDPEIVAMPLDEQRDYYVTRMPNLKEIYPKPHQLEDYLNSWIPGRRARHNERLYGKWGVAHPTSPNAPGVNYAKGGIDVLDLLAQGRVKEFAALAALPAEGANLLSRTITGRGPEPGSYIEQGEQGVMRAGAALGMREVPAESEEQQAAELAGRFMGPGLSLAAIAKRAPHAIGQVPRTAIGKAGQEILRPFREQPGQAARAELAASAGAGVGAAAAEYTDHPELMLPAALAGGVAAGYPSVRALAEGPPGAPRAAPEVPGPAALEPEIPPIRPEQTPAVDVPPVATAGVDAPAPPGMGFEPRISQGLHRNVVDAAEQLLKTGQVTRDPSRLISDQIMELLATERIAPEQFKAVLRANALTPETFAEGAWRVNVRKSAQDLQALSAAEARLKVLTGTADDADLAALDQAGAPNLKALSFWRRAENLRRGLMVTQMATAMRNGVTQVGRLSVGALQEGLDKAILRAFPEDKQMAASPVEAFGSLGRIFWNPRVTKRQVDTVLGMFPKQEDALFHRYSSDLTSAGAGSGAMNRAERGVQILNAANRFQEFAIRRAVFAARMDGALRRRQGVSLQQVVDNQDFGRLDKDSIEEAVQQALEMTWAKDYSPFAKGAEGLAGTFIQFTNRMGIGPVRLTQAIPYPRFLMNAVQFQYEHSPLALSKLSSPAEWKRIAAGDVSTITKASLGSAALLSAYQLRDSEHAGEKWYEVRLPDGRTIDTRAYNPFASYLFVADLAHRMNKGTLAHLTGREIASGILSANVRAGAGLYVIDQILEGISGVDTPERALDALRGYGGTVGSSFLIPLQQVRDVVAEFDESERVIKDRRGSPLTGAARQMVPYGTEAYPSLGLEALPELELATRGAAPVRESPLLRQATGISLRTAKNAGERELDRLGFTRGEILKSTGNAEADQILAKHMGPRVEFFMDRLLANPKYQDFSDAWKAVILLELFAELREGARKAARAEAPKLFEHVKFRKRPRRVRRALQELMQAPQGVSGE